MKNIHLSYYRHYVTDSIDETLDIDIRIKTLAWEKLKNTNKAMKKAQFLKEEVTMFFKKTIYTCNIY